MTTQFLSAPGSDGPAQDRAQAMGLCGRLIGDRRFGAVVHRDDASRFHGHGEIHLGWVLEGRAIQDVRVLSGVVHGTTLRAYDPGIGAPHIVTVARRGFTSAAQGGGRDRVCSAAPGSGGKIP